MSRLLTPYVPDLLLLARKQGQIARHWSTDGSFVFADISGFTKLSEKLAELGKAGAEELTFLLNGTFESLLGVAKSEGGDLVKFGGDALFLFFEGPGHAQRCCRAAAGMRAALKARGPVVTGRGRVVLRISMGVHSGPFLFVLAGEQQRELFVLGEHATMVTDMEGTADAGEILISPSTAAQLPAPWVGAAKGGGVLLRRVEGEPDPGPSRIGGLTDDSPEDEALEALEAFVPRAIRRRLDDGEHGAEHRRTTVAFVHVGGVDDLLRNEGADAVADALDRVVRTTVDAAERHQVSLLATDVAGGGIKLILTAGVPESVEDGEGRMLTVGRAIIDADLGLPVKVGVNTGHVFAGEVGAPWRRVYTVMGDAVNLSARMMSKAGKNELVASRSTLETSATPFELTTLEPFMVKGKRLPQEASLVGTRIEGRGRESMLDVGFVGRRDELATLTTAMAAAVAGTGACAEVVGEPGIGKSRLVHELIARVSDARVVRITCEPFAVDRPYFTARMLLRTALGIAINAPADEAGAALLAWLSGNAPGLMPYSPLLAAAIDATVPPTQLVDDMSPEFRALRLREAASTALYLSFLDPIVLIIEDAMWMDEASALLLGATLRDVANAPWFGCFTTRDLTHGLSSRLGFDATQLHLEPLSASYAETLASELTDTAGVSHAELVELCARANGNPLFLLELAHARRELGSLDAIPGSLEDLIGARIDRLSPSDRRLLRHAAVLGDRFGPRLFERTLGADFPNPVPWDRLRDFIVPDQGELRFGHDLVRRVAYNGLPFRLRRELHGRIGRALIPRGQPDDARLGLLALHFDGSGDHAMAWTYNRMAAERARDNYATLESATLFERAVHNGRAAAAGVPLEELAEALEQMADAAALAGRYDLANEGLRGARRLRRDDDLRFARLCRKEGKLRERLGEHAAAIRWYRRGIATLESGSAPIVQGERAHLAVERASLLILRQKYRETVRWCTRALVDAHAAGERAAEAHAYQLLEWAHSCLGDEDAIRFLEIAQPIYEQLGDYVGMGAVLSNRGVAAVIAGNWDESADHFENSRQAYRRGGDVVGFALATFNLGEQLTDQGRYEPAEQYFREARRVYRSAGHAYGSGLVAGGLGRLMGRSGRHEEGIALLIEARDRFASIEHWPYVAECKVRLAEVHVFAGDDDASLRVLDEAGDSIKDGGAAFLALEARLRGTIASHRGEYTAAAALFETAMSAAQDGGVPWESALAAVELSQLPYVEPARAARLRADADEVLGRLGIDRERVLPPAPVHPTSPR